MMGMSVIKFEILCCEVHFKRRYFQKENHSKKLKHDNSIKRLQRFHLICLEYEGKK